MGWYGQARLGLGPRIITLHALLGLIQSGNVIVERRADGDDEDLSGCTIRLFSSGYGYSRSVIGEYGSVFLSFIYHLIRFCGRSDWSRCGFTKSPFVRGLFILL